MCMCKCVLVSGGYCVINTLIMSFARHFRSWKKRDLSCEKSEAGDDTKKKWEKIAQLQLSQWMMIFF